ncbi:TPA: ribosome recycling factor [bacterium]|nr:ribosome recycling factor [bacterium]
MLKDILDNAKSRMEKALEVMKHEFATIHTGRASPSLINHIQVEYYNSVVPLNQLSSISVSEGHLLIIHPWDKNSIDPIMKAIYRSNLGFTPTTDGNLIRINIPPLTEERRKELDKLIRKRAEESRVAIRNIRRDANHTIKTLEDEHKVSEDEAFKTKEKMQKMTDEFIDKVEKVLATKEKEILEV